MSGMTNRQHLEQLVSESEARRWARPECHRLFILFTPRSGSSWFGDLLGSTKVLGNPDEYLNQDTNIEVVRRFQTRTEIDYLNAIETVTRSGNNVFSMEAIWGHLERSEFDLIGYYHDAAFIYLRRKDILAQAISLFLATETGLFHNPTGQAGVSNAIAERLVAPEKAFRAIRRWWGHLQNYECLADIQFAIRGIRPLRLYYEDLLTDPSAVVGRVMAHAGVDPASGSPAHSAYKPVRSEINEELARLFRREEAEFVETVEAFRPPLL